MVHAARLAPTPAPARAPSGLASTLCHSRQRRRLRAGGDRPAAQREGIGQLSGNFRLVDISYIYLYKTDITVLRASPLRATFLHCLLLEGALTRETIQPTAVGPFDLAAASHGVSGRRCDSFASGVAATPQRSPRTPELHNRPWRASTS
eukprot:jgi/Tetstr1/429843/TSEL_019710.t1